MACSMSITSVLGIPATPGGTVTSTIRVTGKLSGDCAPIVMAAGSFDVVVQVDCGVGPVNAVTLSAGGSWAVDVPTSCSCTKPIVVTAFCATDSNCRDTFTGVLACQQSGCPNGTITVAVGGCDPNGKRAVTLTANVATIPPGTVVGQWDYGDAILGTAFVIPTPGAYTEGPHPYTPPGPYTAKLNIVVPTGCPPLTVLVSGLAPCAIDCPHIVTVIASVAGVCNADGTRTVNFNATVTGGPPQTYYWEFGTPDNASVLIDATLPGATPATSHNYPAPGTGLSPYTATLTVTGLHPSCIDTATRAVDVPGCGGACPTVGNVQETLGSCPSQTTRSVNLTADITGGGATEYVWDFGDATSQTLNAAVNSNPAIDHVYGTPGSYTATITIKGPPGCPEQSASKTFTVPPCRDGNGNGGGSGLCGSLVLVAAALAAMTMAATVFTLALQICPMLIGGAVPPWVWAIVGGLGIAFLAVLALWWTLCLLGVCTCETGCEAAAVLWAAWLSGFVVTLYLLGCCGGNWWSLLLAFAVLFAVLFIQWLVRCWDACLFFKLVLIVFIAVIVVSVIYIAVVPTIFACGSLAVLVTVLVTTPLLVAAVTTCHSGP